MKKILMVLGVFVVMGFVFTGVDVASASEECIVGPLRVSAMPEFATYGDGNVIHSGYAISDRVGNLPEFATYGDDNAIREGIKKGIRVSTPPEMVGPKEQAVPVFPKTTC